MQHFCRHGETICHPNPSYATTKLYGTSTCGCSNNTIFQKYICSRFLPSRNAEHISLAAIRPRRCITCDNMATQLNSIFFVFIISLLHNYRVKYDDYSVKWRSGILVISYVYSNPPTEKWFRPYPSKGM